MPDQKKKKPQKKVVSRARKSTSSLGPVHFVMIGVTAAVVVAGYLFYQQNVQDSLKHSRMSMYISRLYCEKHGGQLLIENEKRSGAVITAVFHRIA